MGNAISAAAAPALCAAFTALELVNLLDPQRRGAGAAAAVRRDPALRGADRAFLLLLPAVAGGVSLLASVAFIYSQLRRAGAAAAAGAGNPRLPELATFTLCASAGFLHFFLFVLQAPGGLDDGAEREIGLAALRALPAAATATFFLGILLIIVGHIRAGGEGGGGAVAGVLAKMAIGAAAGLVCLMATAVCFI